MIKIWCGKNKKGEWKASLDENKLSKFSDVFDDEIPQVNNNHVYIIRIYNGFDYCFGNIGSSIKDDVRYPRKVFHSVSAARKSEQWKIREAEAKKEPEKFIVSYNQIASKDCFGQPFNYGDVMEGKFNLEVIPVRVV